MKKIKIAQIGAGHDHASAALETLKRQNDLYELIGYCVVPEDTGNLPMFSYEGQKSAYDGIPKLTLEEILNNSELDAVCIETEDRALTKYAFPAAQRGLHIQMDKPGGIDGDEFDRLIDLVKEKNLVFHTGYMYRYNPAILELREKIASGQLGEILSVEAQMNCAHGIEKRNWLGHYPGGMLYFLGCHMVDLVHLIMGEPEEVLPLSCSSHLGGTTADDFGMAVFKYKNGLSFAKSTAIEQGGFERRQLVVVGTKGTVEICPLEWYAEDSKLLSPQTTGVREFYAEGFNNWSIAGDRHTSPVHGRYDAMYRAFASYVNREAENPYSYEYERAQHRLLLQACGAK